MSIMRLEDHVGDVVRKARVGRGLEVSSFAQNVGVSLSQYQEFEDSAKLPSGWDWIRVGKLLDLASDRLKALHSGWEPLVRDLGNWRELRSLVTQGPKFTVNNYLIWDEITREAAVFDTGFDDMQLSEILQKESLQLRHIFLTHSHYDHMEALPQIRAKYPKARLHTGSKNAPPEHRNRSNDFIHLGNLRISNRETPGHTEDGVTYLIGNWPEDAPLVAIVGDAIFSGSMGGVSTHFDEAKKVIRDQILSLPEDTLLCPGHGPITTVGEEKSRNPFFGL